MQESTVDLTFPRALADLRPLTRFSAGLWILLFILLGFSPRASAETIRLYFNAASQPIAFAAGDIRNALIAQGHTVQDHALPTLTHDDLGRKIILAQKTDTAIIADLQAQGGSSLPNLGEQAYALRTTLNSHANYWVIGGDAAGAMYGGLQVAENISINALSGSYNNEETPYLRYRGMKLNLPLDRRIPTYVGGWSSHSARAAIGDVWDMSYWTELIDQQARSRYNLLSVWVHHPFPALVSVPEYPNASLPNIQRYDGSIINLNHAQRVAFWRNVMTYAHNRGMKFYFFNWNIYVDHASTQYPALTNSPSNLTTIDYMYKSTKALIDTYPELDGFGITSGDGMDGTNLENTQWTWDAMGKAVYDYLAVNPSRSFNLIHRGVKSDPETCNVIYAPIKTLPNATFNMSAKYAMAHMYSTPTPRWTGDIDSCFNLGLKTFITIRNDDYFYLNWGDPQFVRDFMTGIPRKDTTVEGMYIGIDGYNPTRARLYKNPALNGQLEVNRRWYMEMLWGRLSYNKDTSDEVLKNLLKRRYNLATASNTQLFNAWTLASRSLPKVTELVMKDWSLDFHWYPEACWSDPGRGTGFRTISDAPGATGGFAGQDVANGSNLANIAQSAAGTNGAKKSSYAVANEMEVDATNALAAISNVTSGSNTDLDVAIKNIKQLAYLSRYYAHKIRGATLNKAGNTTLARQEMGKAYAWWVTYTRSMDSVFFGDSFRNTQVLPDWKFADAAALKEYTDLGGVGTPVVDGFATLSVNASNGSVTMNPSGGVYEIGTQVTLTASPNFGYAFSNWAGNLSGTSGQTTLTMDATKNVTAHFVSSSADVAPWVETFPQSNGTKSHGSPTSWQATRAAGTFEVSGNRLMINGGSGATSVEGIFETAPISIPSGSVKASLQVEAAGGADSGDYVRFYKIVDGGAKVLIGQQTGNVTGANPIVGTGITGSNVKLRIEARVSASDEFFFMDDLKLEYENTPATFTLSTSATNGTITLDPQGGIYPPNRVVTVTANPDNGYAFGNWSGDLSGSIRSQTITMTRDKSVTASFNSLTTSGQQVLFVHGGTSPSVTDTAVQNRLIAMGHTVTMIQDSQSNTLSASGKGLVIISSTVGSGNVGTKFRDVAVPVINWETFVQDDFGFTANVSTDFGTAAGQTSLIISNAAHPLAAGLTAGNQTVATSGNFSFGMPGGSAIIIARLNDTTNRPCIYAYETGTAMTFGTAPARRVNLFFQGDTYSTLTAAGSALFDAAVNWSIGQNPPTSYPLTTTATNGSITLSPAGGLYTSGTPVTATALASSGYRFGSWSGDLTGSSLSGIVTMTTPKSITANFIRIHNVSVNALNGSVTLNPQRSFYDAGSLVTVTASPAQGFRFKEWSGALNGAGATTSVTIDTDQTLTPVFEVIIPVLKCQRNGAIVTLKWPVDSSPAWMLEWTATLGTPTSWTVIEPPYPSDTTEIFWQGPAVDNARFFRLRHP